MTTIYGHHQGNTIANGIEGKDVADREKCDRAIQQDIDCQGQRGQYLLRNKNLYKVIKICIDAFVPSLVESTETFVSPLVLVASVTEIDEELSGSVDPLTSATVVEDSENRAKHIKSTELVVTDIWKRYLVLYNNKNRATYVFIFNYMSYVLK